MIEYAQALALARLTDPLLIGALLVAMPMLLGLVLGALIGRELA